jgi:predicted MPP superfamily phosphohydrolase
MFIAVGLAILALVYGYTGWRFIAPWDLPAGRRAAAWCTVAVLLVLAPAAEWLQMTGAGWPGAGVVAWAAYIGAGSISIAFPFFLVRDAAYLAAIAAGKLAFRNGFRHSAAKTFLRRSTAAIGILVVALTVAGLAGALRRPAVREVVLSVPGLDPAWERLTVAQVTDIHVGPTIGRPFVEDVVRQVNSLEPDLVFITGDLVDGPVRALGAKVAPLAEISAPLGKFFVTGNHEYYSGVAEWIDTVRALGYVVLMNEHRVLVRSGAPLVVAGVTDYHAGSMIPEHASDPSAAAAGAPEGAVKLLLAHQPLSMYEADAAGFDIMLSGHTHGGQNFPYTLVVNVFQPLPPGLHRFGGLLVYVSRGTGYWGPPLRLGSPSEITLFTLMAAPE